MKILILRSVPNSISKDQFSVCMDVHYANRVIGHLTDKGKYCQACADNCVVCRKGYDLDFSRYIAGVLEFPAVLPGLLEEPEEHLPAEIPDHDICIAISVNEELLVSFVEKFSVSKGIVIPIEGSNWISPNAIGKITEICGQKGIEVSFPKPFCSFRPSGGILSEFRRRFRIGRPEVEYVIRDDVITDTKVLVSAPCGATYFTCRGLIGRRIDDNLAFIIDKQLSAYPCTADHSVDREFNDSITHQAVKIQSDILTCWKKNN